MWPRSETFAEDRRRARERAVRNELLLRGAEFGPPAPRATRIDALHAAVEAWRCARPVRLQFRIIRE